MCIVWSKFKKWVIIRDGKYKVKHVFIKSILSISKKIVLAVVLE